MKGIKFILFLILHFYQIGFTQDSLRSTVYFEINSFTISEKERSKLTKEFDDMDFDSILSINIMGYCDDTGEKTYNDSLSLKRAQTIAKIAVQELKIENKTKVLVVGKGQIQLANISNLSKDEERAKNRKVDFELVYNKSNPIALQEVNQLTPKQPEQIEIEESKQIEIEKLEVGDTLMINNLLFKPGASKFQSESYMVLNDLLQSLRTNTDYKIKILGHINYTSTNPYNLPNKDSRDRETGKPLSIERAKAVFDYLVKNGIDKTRLSYEGLGGLYPIVKENEMNMRVEIVLLNK